MTDGLLLGKISNVDYETKRVKLSKGDAIFVYTDGVSEAMDSEMNQYQEDRLQAYLKTTGSRSIQEVVQGSIADLKKHTGGAPQSDDITVLSLRYVGKNGT